MKCVKRISMVFVLSLLMLFVLSSCGRSTESKDVSGELQKNESLSDVIDKPNTKPTDSKFSDGLSYTLSDDGLYYIVTGIGGCTDTEIIIPNEYNKKPVKRIGDEAFSDCTELVSITIADNVNSIGLSAFCNCTGLESVTFGVNSTLSIINERAFYGCIKLNKINLPDNLKETSKYVFENCNNLTKIELPDAMSKINAGVFKGSGLVSITIPDSVTVIGNDAFRDCCNLESVLFGANSELTKIGSNSFDNCTKLTTINLPNIVEEILSGAFIECSSLTSMELPRALTQIEGFLFKGCSSLKSITIPESITTIKEEAFKECESLEDVYITNIAAWCNIHFYLDSNIFGYAEKLYINNELATDIIIPEGVEIIRANAFEGYKGLTSVTISNSVEIIDDSAFKGTGLTNIIIPQGVKNINGCAFKSCKSLESITLSNSVASINDDAFEYCSGLKEVIFNGSKTEWNSIPGVPDIGSICRENGGTVTYIGSAN